MPVQTFTIETISDLSDKRLVTFRENIFKEDLGLDSKLIREDKPHSWWMENIPSKVAEDAFKYCDRKWNTVTFDNIEAIIEDGEIVGISGCKTYSKFLRTSMHLYLLKRVRSKYPGIKYIEGGWFERHIAYATKSNLSGLFFTVYAHSRKLKALIRNHGAKTISLVDKQHLKYMSDIHEKGEYLFNNVPQTFFYYQLLTPIEQFDPNEFI